MAAGRARARREGADEAAAARAWGVGAGQGAVEAGRRGERSAAARGAEATWHRTRSLTKKADGSLTWRARVSGTLEIRPWILGWGADVEVLAPDTLRGEVAGSVRRAAARSPRR